MAVMKKREKNASQNINSGSLPDIIFTLLFFFMVSTSMREVTMKVKTELPSATEVQKLEKKSLVSYIYVGPPTKELRAKWGDRPRLQLNNDFSTSSSIRSYIAAEKDKLNEADRFLMTVSLKIDKGVKMGIVTDVKERLREANALKISYTASKVARGTHGYGQ